VIPVINAFFIADRETSGGMPDVTVAIACFNYGRFLPEAVESARSQGAHVVVVDDGSTDPATQAALDALPDDVEVVRQANAGVCNARNAGLSRATTPYLLALDADDRLAPGALEALKAPLDSDPTLGFAYGHMRFFGDWQGELRFPPYNPYTLLYRHTIGLSALMRRELFADTGGFDQAFETYEDWELWLHALEHGWHGRQVDVVALEYRRHGGTKHGEDRRRYREHFRQLRRKHAGLYARSAELARESGTGLPARLVHRLYWGPRPVPAGVESTLWKLRWGGAR
jgi:glycosyltransferase involved in cell wall biosynthesis